MPITNQQIRYAVANSPDLQLLTVAPRNDIEIARILNLTAPTKPASKIVTRAQLVSLYPEGQLAAEALLLKLLQARDSLLSSPYSEKFSKGAVVGRQLWLLDTDGLNLGDSAVTDIFDSFASVFWENIITTAEVTNLKAMALVPDTISVEEVTVALNEL